MITLSGVNIEVGPREKLTAQERVLLETYPPAEQKARSDFEIQLVEEPLWEDDGKSGRYGEPARLFPRGVLLELRHVSLTGLIDPRNRRATLFRSTAEAYPLQIMIRVAVQTTLPLVGGMLVHAAGVVIDRHAVIFFGASGAGKTTLASRSPYPVLSDELVAVFTAPGTVAASSSGFWGTLAAENRIRSRFPVAAMIALHRGSEFSLHHIEPEKALRRLLHVTVVPLVAPLWREGMKAMSKVVGDVPFYEMTWTLTEAPWNSLRDALIAEQRLGDNSVVSAAR